jgi:hypothetical protein
VNKQPSFPIDFDHFDHDHFDHALWSHCPLLVQRKNFADCHIFIIFAAK